MNDSGSQTIGTGCVLLTTEGPLMNVECWDNGIRIVDKKEHSVSYAEDGGGWRVGHGGERAKMEATAVVHKSLFRAWAVEKEGQGGTQELLRNLNQQAVVPSWLQE